MEKSFKFKSSTIFYQVQGEGIPVVLIHGFAEGSFIWKRQVEFLKHYCRVVVPELPGSGKSEMLNYKPDITIDDYADCIYELLKQENITGSVVLGHSMGGYIALAFAEKYAFALRAFGFIHSTAFADNEEKKTNRQKGIEMMENYGAYAFVKSTTPNLFGKKFKAEHPEQVQELIDENKQISKEVLQQYYGAMMNRPDRIHVLKSSKQPLLFILGTEDVATPLNDLLQQVHLPEIACLNIIEETGHMSMWEASDKLNNYCLNFLELLNTIEN